MNKTLRELKEAERYYNRFIIKQSYDRCMDDIYDDNRGIAKAQRNKNNDYDEGRKLPLAWIYNE